ncbi:unnamed protein product [Polarella glacialis]|uniref:Folate/biopterin transporter n=1 Tax=Polarella glacialis TaxID=89957 RepID=A0A813LYU5_POLGL|nr:unnamed protein product [Polarella glacialis]CAE8743416.1 unnamed protein product [Polarella glacialis]
MTAVASQPPGVAFPSWLSRLQEAFGGRLLLCLAIAHGGLKGFNAGGGNAGLVGVPIDFLLREFQVDAASLQVYKAAVMLPWSIKPLLGLLSDGLPVCGYHRLPYFVISALAGSCACLAIPLLPNSSLLFVLFLLFCIFLQVSWTDLLSEAVYSVRLKEFPSQGPNLISFVWGAIAVGKLASVALVGPIMGYFGNRAPYLAGFPVALLALLIPFFNLAEERPSQERRCARVSGADLPLAVVALVIGAGALGLGLVSVLGGSLQLKVAAAGALAVLCLGLVSLTLSPVIAKVNAFFFLQHLCSLSIDGASFYFFTDGEEQYAEGPHFSTVFYTSVLGLVSTACSLLGMFAYNRWLQHWSYPRILIVGNLLSVSVSLLSCVVFLRWNLRLGISDRFFVLASGAVSTVVFEIAWLPGMLIISQLCPEGREATMFALLAGMANLGMALGSYFGAFLLHTLGVEPRGALGESAQFDRLWLAALLAALGPCLPLCLVHVLVPDVGQQEKIKGLDSATQGSPLARFLARRRRKVPENISLEMQSIVGSPAAWSEVEIGNAREMRSQESPVSATLLKTSPH